MPGTARFPSTVTCPLSESIYIYAAENEKEMPKIVVDYGEGKISTLYDRMKLKERDAYELFLGGSHEMVNIRTTADTTDRLLLVKDSYANCLIPFLVPYFREIIAVLSLRSSVQIIPTGLFTASTIRSRLPPTTFFPTRTS